MNTAKQVAALLGNDGSRFAAKDGRDLHELCQAHGARVRATENLDRFQFPDGSAIVANGTAWDLSFPDCNCWQSEGHDEHCRYNMGDLCDLEGVPLDPAYRNPPELIGYDTSEHMYNLSVVCADCGPPTEDHSLLYAGDEWGAEKWDVPRCTHCNTPLDKLVIVSNR